VGTPSLSWKYAWAKALFGWNFAKHMQVSSRKMRWQVEKVMDKLLLLLEGEKPGASKGSPQGESSNLFRLRSTDASSQTTGGE
jgi:hypothetical protein